MKTYEKIIIFTIILAVGSGSLYWWLSIGNKPGAKDLPQAKVKEKKAF